MQTEMISTSITCPMDAEYDEHFENENGAHVPETIITTDGQAVRAFILPFNPYEYSPDWKKYATSYWVAWAKTATHQVRLKTLGYVFGGSLAECRAWITSRQSAAATRAALQID